MEKKEIAALSDQELVDKIKEGKIPTQYVISYESPSSSYYGSLINYNTILLFKQDDLKRVSEEYYRGRKVLSSFHQLNQKDFKLFKEKQKSFFHDPENPKRLSRVIYAFPIHDKGKEIPSYLKS